MVEVGVLAVLPEPPVASDDHGPAAISTVGQLVRVLQRFPPDTPVEAGLGYACEAESYPAVTVGAVIALEPAGESVATVVVLGETERAYAL